jgi:dUTP pyrophosphatase
VPVEVLVKQLPSGHDLPIPRYQSEGAAGLDLHAAVEADTPIEPGRVVQVPCGLQLAIPAGFEGQVRPRSGLAKKSAVTVANAPGTIDSDYRGELCVLLINLGSAPFTVRRGDRIAQLVIAPVAHADLRVVEELPGTVRGAGGFGHTGV